MDIETPSTPALTAAQAEHTDIFMNPRNPRYEAFRRGDPQVSAYIDPLYKKALPNNAPVPIVQESVSATTDFSDDWESQAEIDTALRQEFGDSYDTVMREMSAGAQYLFNGNEGQHALTVLTERMSALGPKTEALGVKFLADLAHLQSQGG